MTSIYDPPMLIDLALSYSFVDGGLPGMPAWAENARLSLLFRVQARSGKCTLTPQAGALMSTWLENVED